MDEEGDFKLGSNPGTKATKAQNVTRAVNSSLMKVGTLSIRILGMTLST